METIITIARWGVRVFLHDPLWILFRFGPRIAPCIPMYGGASDAELCHLLVPDVSVATWSQIPDECEAHIQKHFTSWQVLVSTLMYFYVLSSVLRLMYRSLAVRLLRGPPPPPVVHVLTEAAPWGLTTHAVR